MSRFVVVVEATESQYAADVMPVGIHGPFPTREAADKFAVAAQRPLRDWVRDRRQHNYLKGKELVPAAAAYVMELAEKTQKSVTKGLAASCKP